MATDLNRSIKIYIDNSDAMKSATELKSKIAALQAELQNLSNQGKKDSEEYIKKEKALNQLQGTYGRYQEKVKETERILKNLSGSTEKELLAVRKQLRKELIDTTRNTEEYKVKLETLKKVESELLLAQQEKSSSMGRNATMFNRMADGFNKYFGIVASFVAALTGVSYTIRKLAEDVAVMDDTYADVIKTTGMTRDQVLDLNEEFKRMDTRTARDSLNLLARDAGKLGLSSKKDVLDFVEAGNQINVALGEDLGEGAIKNIGKITEVFKLSTKELNEMDLKGRMLAVGSAINELGQSSTAAEPYMVNFTQRLGGVASQAGISVQNILGYASALDQSGQAVEMSATALQKFIMSIMGDPAKFAKIAGLEITKFNKLLKEDTNAAIKEVLTALSQKGGFQALIPIFKEMGLDGARAVGVLSALATNIDKVDEAQRIANTAFSEGVSISNEYAVKNNNLMALLEKQRKAFKDAALELGERLNPALLQSTKWTTYLIKILPSVLDLFQKYGIYVAYLAASYVTYIAGIKMAIVYEKTQSFFIAINKMRLAEKALAQALVTGNTVRAAAAERLYSTAVTKSSIAAKAYTAVITILSAAKNLLAGNTTKARQALQSLSTTMKLTPAGLLSSGILVLVAAMGYLLYKVNNIMTATKAVKKATEEYNDEMAKEQSNIDKLFRAYKKSNPESDEHRKIKEKIITQYGPLLKGLIDERGRITNIEEAYRRVNKELREQIALKIKNAATDTIQTESIKNQLQNVNSVVSNITDQLKLGSEQQNELRELLNTKINEITIDDNWDFRTLQSELNKVAEDFGAKLNHKTGFWEPTNLYTEIAGLSSGIHNSRNEINKVSDQFKGLISDATELNKVLNNDITDVPNLDSSDPAPSKGGTQSKELLNRLLEDLETKHQQRLFQIKDEYRNGTIKSESEYNSKLYAQEQAHLLIREQALIKFNATVKDAALQSDISKQIATIQNKQIDQELEFRAKIEQIILDANPEEKERLAYENRLRDAKVFGCSRNELLFEISVAENDSEKNLLQQKLQVLELLEKQHGDNMVRIRKDVRRKAKAAVDESAEENFAERKALLEEEIAAEEQRISLLTGMGAMVGQNAFNAEVELQKKRIALVKEESEAKLEILQNQFEAQLQAMGLYGVDRENLTESQLKNLEKLELDYQSNAVKITKDSTKKQKNEELSLTHLYVGEYQRRTQQFAQYGEAMGVALGNTIANQESLLKAFGGTAIDILFDVLTSIINSEIAGVTAVVTGAIAKITANEISSKGFLGIGTAAVLTGIVTAAMVTAKTALKGMLGGVKGGSSSSGSSESTSSGSISVAQRAQGKYDVIGEQDNKLYKDVEYQGLAQTGVVSRPTLVGEQGSELIVSSPDFKALQKHINYPLVIQAIQESRSGHVPQRAAGKYDSLSRPESRSDKANVISNSPFDQSVMVRLTKVLDDLNKYGVHSNIGVTELQANLNSMNKENSLFSKKI